MKKHQKVLNCGRSSTTMILKESFLTTVLQFFWFANFFLLPNKRIDSSFCREQVEQQKSLKLIREDPVNRTAINSQQPLSNDLGDNLCSSKDLWGLKSLLMDSLLMVTVRWRIGHKLVTKRWSTGDPLKVLSDERAESRQLNECKTMTN